MEGYHIDSLCSLRQQTCRDKFSDIVRGVFELRTTGKVVISISKHNYWPITVEPSGQPVATVAPDWLTSCSLYDAFCYSIQGVVEILLSYALNMSHDRFAGHFNLYDKR